MAWIKWHVGAATDPKFRLIAKKAGTNVPAVLSVWLMLLERASEADGDFTGFDPEVAEIAMGIKAGKAQAILDAMREKGMIEGNVISAWEERQGKRETAGASSSTARVQRHRKKAAAMAQDKTDVTPETLHETDVTPCNGNETVETACNVSCNAGETVETDVTPCNALRIDKNRIDKIKNIKETYCAEPSAEGTAPAAGGDKNPPVFELPLNTGAMHPIAADSIAQWQALYPAVDVMQQLRNMRGWLEANATRRKTKSGIMKFINGWLAKEQNRGGSVRASPGAAVKTFQDLEEERYQQRLAKARAEDAAMRQQELSA